MLWEGEHIFLAAKFTDYFLFIFEFKVIIVDRYTILLDMNSFPFLFTDNLLYVDYYITIAITIIMGKNDNEEDSYRYI